MGRIRVVVVMLLAVGVAMSPAVASAATPNVHPAVAAGCTAGKIATSSLTISPSTVTPRQQTTTAESVTNCTAKSLPVKVTGMLVPPKGCGKTMVATIGQFTLPAHGTRANHSTSRAPACLGRYVFTLGVINSGKTVSSLTRTLTVVPPKP